MKKIIIFIAIVIAALSACTTDNSTISVNTGSVGKINGSIIDDSGNFISDVSVSTSPQTDNVKSDANGSFQIFKVPSGNYNVSASKNGYSSASVDVKVAAGYASHVQLILKKQTKENHPPLIPTNPSPQNQSTIKQTAVTISWECTDPDGDALVFDVYFGTVNPPSEKITENLQGNSFSVSNLSDLKTYFWKVIARDPSGAENTSDVWNFQTNTGNPGDEGLVAYFNFNGNANSSTGIIGTAYGISWATDRFGNNNAAGNFGNNNDYVEAISPAFNLKNDITIACWIKPDLNTCKDFQTHIDIIDLAQMTNGVYQWYGLGITVNLGIEYWTSGYDYIGYDSSPLINNTWSHIAIVYRRILNSNQGTATLYRNGLQYGEPKIITGSTINPDRILIGVRPNNYTDFGGLIDDVYIYSRALTANEIQQLAK